MASFKPYGWTHLIVILVCALGIWGLVVLARRWRGTPSEATFRGVFGGSILAVNVGWFAWLLLPSNFNVDRSLPLHLCDFAWMASAWSLMAAGPPQRPLHQVVCYWTIGLSILGFITPAMTNPPTELRFYVFWVAHFQVIATGVLNIAAFGVRPDTAGWRATVAVSVLLFIPVTLFNLIFETPYFFSGRGTPDNPTPIDLLGPWPLRLLWMILLVVAWLGLLRFFFSFLPDPPAKPSDGDTDG